MSATRPPAETGMHLQQVDTPALLLDLDAFERNLDRMAETTARSSVRLRPHAKTHKCPVIGLRQMSRGAVGVCCQKVSEAEAMIYGGIPDVLISNEVVGAAKLTRLMGLATQARVAVCADHPDNVTALAAAARLFGVRLSVYVEVNVGGDRCGVEPGEPAAALARRVADADWLTFAGLQAYHGPAQHVRHRDERRQHAKSAAEKIAMTLEACNEYGLPCPIVGGGGTGTWLFDIEQGAINEIQAGSYIFMDADYRKNLEPDGSGFESALFVYTTVMSRPTPDRAVVDAGLKALSVDSGMPAVHEMPDVEYTRAADEHGKLSLTRRDRAIALGDKLRLVPGHCDPTVNLYDWYVAFRGDRVECLWPVSARGAVL